PVCRSTDPRDRRMRCSAMVEADGRRILIDCGPDFREQMLRFYPEGDLDALLVTHHHYDHVGGCDDLRPYCKGKDAFEVYCNADTAADMHRRMPYCFAEHPYPGVPRYSIHEVKAGDRFNVHGIEVEALQVNHYLLEILAYRIGPLGYITDAKHIPDATINAMKGVDTLVINALRHKAHISHMTLEESLQAIARISPRRAYLTHLSHDMGFTADLIPLLPEGVFAAQDGMTVMIPE
ncbi:MAG: MBL fold metallo-hydrolase, partial [Muribaculaceae bacterium]|nr:MBL fold metallo-hydrolase [Muribaculaceae bacterium]